MKNTLLTVLCCLTLLAVVIDIWSHHGGTVQAQSGATVYVQNVGVTPVEQTVKVKGAKVIGFSCTATGDRGFCFVASE
jgi:hypothetical protein